MFYRYFLMRVIAMTGLYAVVFPAVMQLGTGFEGIESGFGDFVYGWVVMICGFIFPLVLTRKLLPAHNYINTGKFKIFKKLIFTAMVVTPIIGAIKMYEGSKASFYALSGILYFYLGVRGYYKEYFDILGQKTIFMGIFLCLGSVIETTVFSKCAIYEDVLLYFIYAFIIIAAIVLNQNSLDIAVKTNGTVAAGKARIRFFNIFCVLIILLIILWVVDFSNTISAVKSFYSFLKSFPSYMMGLATYIVYILGFLTRKSDKVPEPSIKEQEGNNPFYIEKVQTDNTIVIIVLIVIFLIILGLLLFIFGKRLINWINQNVFKKIISFFKYLNSLISSFFSVDNVNEEKYYIDEFSKVQKEYIDSGQKEYVKKTARSFDYIDKIVDPVEKVRYIFGLIIESLVYKGVNITKSDTVSEINEKVPQELKEDEYFKDLSEIYNKTRYGGIIPDESKVKNARDICKELLQRI